MESLIPLPTEVNNSHKVYSVTIVTIVLTVIAIAVVLARLVARLRAKTFGADDWATIPATIFYIGWSVLAVYINLNAGVGKPLWEITLPEYSLWFKGIAATAWLYPIMSASIRASIILFYRRLFSNGTNLATRRILVALLIFQFVYVAAFSIAPGFVCSPLHFAWQPDIRHLYCDDFYYSYTTISLYAASLVCDLALLVLPIYPISKLNMRRGKRAGILFIFLLGAGACIAAAYKLAIFAYELRDYKNTSKTFLTYLASRFIPGSFNGYGTTFWIPCQVESTAALIGASLPAISRHVKLTTDPIVSMWSVLLSGSHGSRKRTTDREDSGFQPLSESEVQLRAIKL